MSKRKKKSGDHRATKLNLIAAILNLVTALILLIEKLLE